MDRAGAQEAYQRGLDQMDMNQFDPAIASFSLAVGRDPDCVEAYMARGTVFMKKGSHDQAIADFDRADRLSPGVRNVYALRGAAYRALGRLTEAAADYARAVKQYPDNAHYRDLYEQVRGELEEGNDRPP